MSKVFAEIKLLLQVQQRVNAGPLRSLLIYTAGGHRGVNSPPSILCLSK